jgi:hypothetical protein
MEIKGTNKTEPLAKMLKLLETVIKKRKLDRQHHRDEMEKHFTYLCQGKDLLNVYERRNAGITDEEWNNSFLVFKKYLSLE